MTLRLPRRSTTRLVLLLGALVLVAAACAPGGSPGSPGAVTPTPQAAIPLVGAQPSDPLSLLAWLFHPIFQGLFIAMVLLDKAVGNIAIAIVILTILMRALLIPIFRRQLVSQRRMQLIAPELKELQRRHKGDRQKQMEVQQRFYKERGINPASGCLPLLLQLVLLIPMYSVISQGLQNFNPQAMMDVFGFRILDLGCDAAPIVDASGRVTNPCLNPIAFGVDWSVPEILFPLPFITGLSLLAVFSSVLQLVQSRMTLPQQSAKSDDPNTRVQRQMVVFLPLISILYGGILPAGLFLYWIFTTVFSIIQQYLIIGWGSMFPLFGWYPSFARDHTPRFPVATPQPVPIKDATGAPSRQTPAPRRTDPAATIRPSQRGRQGRRGRRR